jgi:hypothetical protein
LEYGLSNALGGYYACTDLDVPNSDGFVLCAAMPAMSRGLGSFMGCAHPRIV